MLIYHLSACFSTSEDFVLFDRPLPTDLCCTTRLPVLFALASRTTNVERSLLSTPSLLLGQKHLRSFRDAFHDVCVFSIRGRRPSSDLPVSLCGCSTGTLIIIPVDMGTVEVERTALVLILAYPGDRSHQLVSQIHQSCTRLLFCRCWL